MEMSVREARAQFAHALSAAERGERVVITKNGRPVAELGPPSSGKGGLDLDRMKRVSKALGIGKSPHPLDERWRERFDDQAWAQELFGAEYLGGDPDPRP